MTAKLSLLGVVVWSLIALGDNASTRGATSELSLDGIDKEISEEGELSAAFDSDISTDKVSDEDFEAALAEEGDSMTADGSDLFDAKAKAPAVPKDDSAKAPKDIALPKEKDNKEEAKAPKPAEQKTSALQLTNNKQFSMKHTDLKPLLADALPQAASAASDEAPAPSDFENAITNLVMGKSALGSTPMGQSVKKLRELIETRMMGAVLDAHKASQDELNRLMGHLHSCKEAKETDWKDVKKQLDIYHHASPLHKECRAAEAVHYTTARGKCEGEISLLEVKRLKCKLFAETAQRVGDGKANREIVTKGGSESIDTYVKRISATICGNGGDPNGPESRRRRGGSGGIGGLLDEYDKAREECKGASDNYRNQVEKCIHQSGDYRDKRKQCNAFQEQMDGAACQRAVLVKDACETYAECYKDKLETYETAKGTVEVEEKDRKHEWHGLKRMLCLLDAFNDGKVTNAEVDECKAEVHASDHLIITYPEIPEMEDCQVPKDYPSTGIYKLNEYVPLPAVAKGRESKPCTGVAEISTTPLEGSPDTCKCQRVTLNGPFSPGPLVKCMHCLDARRTKDKNSCPEGTKIFSPRSRIDWDTFIKSAEDLREPSFIIDVTRPVDGIGGANTHAMHSKAEELQGWATQDGSPWWFRGVNDYTAPSTEYHANCYLDLVKFPENGDSVTWNYNKCEYHSKSYYCQARAFSTKPAPDSPPSCSCKKVELAGPYEAKLLIKCEQCIDVYKATEKNSCPKGMKIFSPASREDWGTFIRSAKPLRSPNFIIDITQPSNGCGGCQDHAMNTHVPNQAVWVTSDGSPWWLRSTKYEQPNAASDYYANCYMDLWHPAEDENAVTFAANKCEYHSNSYYCQPWRHAKTMEEVAAE